MSDKAGHWNIDLREGVPDLTQPRTMTQQSRVEADTAEQAIELGLRDYFQYIQKRQYDLAGGRRPMQPVRQLPAVMKFDRPEPKKDCVCKIDGYRKGEFIVATATPIREGDNGWERDWDRSDCEKPKSAVRTPAPSRSDS